MKPRVYRLFDDWMVKWWDATQTFPRPYWIRFETWDEAITFAIYVAMLNEKTA